MLSNTVLALVCSIIASAFAWDGKDIRDVAVFPLGNWLENIAVRANGDLLVTRIDQAQVISVNPFTGRTKVVFDFPATTSALGIAEVERDVFAVATGNYSTATGTTAGSYSIWQLDLRSSHAKARKAADITPAGILNGVIRLDDGRVLVADSVSGVVYRVDLRTGAFSVALSGPEYELAPPPAFQLGVNGLRVVNSTLYFTNSGTGTISRVRITSNGSAAGPVEQLAGGLELPDDFAVGPRGELFVTVNIAREVDRITADGKRTRIAGGANSTDFATPTSAQFGRTVLDSQTLYVVTGGVRDDGGNALSPAKVLAINTRRK